MRTRTSTDPMRDLRLAIRRLETSKGKRIARRNARRAFLRAVNAVKKEFLQRHPCLDESGNEIIPRREKGLRCPACQVPMQNVKMFAAHWLNAHDRHPSITCACGKRWGPREIRQNVKLFCCHIRGLKDIQAHFTLGALAGIASNNGAKP